MKIDAHHHLWQYTPEEFDWLSGDLEKLRRHYGVNDLVPLLRNSEVTGTVAVQARQTVPETEMLLSMAGAWDCILGVVGWLPLEDACFPALLESLASNPLLRGLRHVLQNELTGFMDKGSFRRGLAHLESHGLVFDLLIRDHQLTEATRLVDAFPNQQFILDHIGKPQIARKVLEPWKQTIERLALRPNVMCKVSGMVTEAQANWNPDDLKPYFDIVLQAFGPARMLAGSDWPVVEASSSYAAWWRLLESWTADWPVTERQDFFAGNATRAYRLEIRTQMQNAPEQGGKS